MTVAVPVTSLLLVGGGVVTVALAESVAELEVVTELTEVELAMELVEVDVSLTDVLVAIDELVDLNKKSTTNTDVEHQSFAYTSDEVVLLKSVSENPKVVVGSA